MSTNLAAPSLLERGKGDVVQMRKAYELVHALSIGNEPAMPFRMAWGVHDGLRGATWTIVASDGTVLTNTIRPMRGPAAPQKPTELGRMNSDELRILAAIMCAQRFDLIEIPPLEVPVDPTSARVELAISIPDERFSLTCPSCQLASLFGLAEIGRIFGEIRQRYSAP